VTAAGIVCAVARRTPSLPTLLLSGYDAAASGPAQPAAEELGVTRPTVDRPSGQPGATFERVGQWLEVVIYVVGGFFLLAAAGMMLLDTVPLLRPGAGPSTRALSILDHILLVFVLVEVFHTVRLAVTRHEIRAEPFLIVALIAGVRRILVVTVGNESLGRDSLIELGLLIVLLLASSGALLMLRPPRAG
jgi:uncharacterized membrane protein (DUF373 family)